MGSIGSAIGIAPMLIGSVLAMLVVEIELKTTFPRIPVNRRPMR